MNPFTIESFVTHAGWTRDRISFVGATCSNHACWRFPPGRDVAWLRLYRAVIYFLSIYPIGVKVPNDFELQCTDDLSTGELTKRH